MSVHDIARPDRPLELGAAIDASERDAACHVAGSTAQDLHDAVAAIQLHADALEDRHDAADPRRQDAARIRLAAERACQLARQLVAAGPPAVRAPLAAIGSAVVPASGPVIEAASLPAEPRPESSRSPRVLVVDDDPTLRRMLVRLLRRAEFEVVDVGTGRGALAVLDGRHFDVIVSDIHMPDGDGLELLRSVRRVDLDIPVILMSGRPEVETAATALELGAFRYLTKPLDADTVESLVRGASRAHALARIRREAMALAGGGEPGATDRAGLEVRFDQAMDKLWMAFQPIVEARSGALFGVEALMRSREPSIPTPPALLDAAIQLKRLPVLGRRTRSLAGVAITERSDIPSLFVNLHPADLLDVDLIDGAAPLTQIASRVILEVTEREALRATPALTARLERIRELGFRIAVDDIGAGYSGLTNFTELTPEIVKLDMALVRSIHASTVKQRTVGALCALCHEMGTLVVGEGVETADERDCLLAIGCDLLQGYLIARPSSELPLPSEPGSAGAG